MEAPSHIIWWLLFGILLQSTNGINVTPSNVNSLDGITVTQNEPRSGRTDANKNGVVGNQFQVNDQWNNLLGEWGLVLELDASTYGFKKGADSTLSITLNAEIGSVNTNDLDVVFAFSIADEKYMTFFTMLDGVGLSIGPRTGKFIYPAPADGLEDGDPALIYNGSFIPPPTSTGQAAIELRNIMAGGDLNDWYKFSNSVFNAAVGTPFTATFDLRYDDTGNEQKFYFTFDGDTESYDNITDITSKNVKLYISMDIWSSHGQEQMRITSFDITGQNTGTLEPTPQPTNDPTEAPSMDPCDLDVETYLQQYYCVDNGQSGMAIKSPFDQYENNGYKHNEYHNNYFEPDAGQGKYNYNEIPKAGNDDRVLYLILFAILAHLVYSIYINGCKRRSQDGYRKVYDTEYDSERHAIKA